MGKWFEVVLERFATLSGFVFNFENVLSRSSSTRYSNFSKES
jgi:hypothetical protein